MSGAHGGVADPKIEHAARRVESGKLSQSLGGGPPVGRKRLCLSLEGIQQLIRKRTDRVLDDERDQRLGRVVAAGVSPLAGVSVNDNSAGFVGLQAEL